MAIHRLDVTKETSVKQVLQTVAKISGKLHLLINNATIDYSISIEDMTPKHWDETFDVRAKVIHYLDSEEAEYLNGEEIYVNGANHLRPL